MDHSYEEIRSAALDILSGREKSTYEANQFEHLKIGVGEVFARRTGQPTNFGRDSGLSNADEELFLEMFWDLFRQGIITLGFNRSNKEFPFFRVARAGRQAIQNQGLYFFHDVSSFTSVIQKEVPTIDPITLLYLQEAMQAFRSGCILSSSVMLGVATEHSFLLLVEEIEKSSKHAATFAAVGKERTILQKVNKFKSILDQQRKNLPPAINEDLDTHFAGILSIIRNFRNQSGHPSGNVLGREQAYILLQLFVPYCKKIYALRSHYK